MAIRFNGFRLQIPGYVAFPVEELAAYVGVRQNPFVPVALQGAFCNVQQSAHVRAVDSAVRGLRIELLPYLPRKGGQFFQPVEDVYSCFLPDANHFFHRFNSCFRGIIVFLHG